MSKKTAAS